MYGDTTRQNLRAIVGAYRKATKTSLSVVSKRFYGNARFLDAFFAGDQSIGIDKLDRMIEDMKTAWPANTPWPDCLPVTVNPPERHARENNSVETAPAA